QQHLNYMGLDSLVAVNLRNRLQTKLSVHIPITKFMEELTIAALSTELNQQLTQLEQKHTSGLDNNQQLQSGNVNDSDWIEVDL
ncbi:MAG: acyl carrier protein, partial [Moorea sp. SIO3E2]|nr:acyl carrier protein [Moorena sp. SIO3E2]